eukprot:CAMPEP_0185736104 /NCGR_PEP_ID=MMETSP1171-20130828/26910_1 /TAXON_ID=374046 /ORGANISM="Helicotheca tamensis, Strain CCMP826" /LENGTH=640 /DNA_ID=CAMNT_0028406613 /DNA_START=67 /DNA_END=1985 /DNA_ORIENTATION=+
MASEGSDSELRCSVLGSSETTSSGNEVMAVRRASKTSMTDVSLGGLMPLLNLGEESEEDAGPAAASTSSSGGLQDFLSGDSEGSSELEAEVRRRRARNNSITQGTFGDMEADAGAQVYSSSSDSDSNQTPGWLDINRKEISANQDKALIKQQGDKESNSLKKKLRKWRVDDYEAEGGKINFWPFASFGVFGRPPPKDLEEEPIKDPPSKPPLRRGTIAAICVAVCVGITLAFGTYIAVESALFFDRSDIIVPGGKAERDFCIQNGLFQSDPPSTEHWYSIGSHLELKQKGFTSSDSVLLAMGRTEPPQQISGMYQNVPGNCFTPSKWYIVHARVLLREAFSGKLFYCDPTIMWGNHEKSCPTVNLKMMGGPAQEIAWTVGHNDPDENNGDDATDDGWMNMEGAFLYPVSDELKGSEQVDIVSITRAPLGVDIVLDSLTILPMNEQERSSSGRTSCDANIIANGDAEAGDHRFWFIRGTGSDTNESIQISPSRHKQFGFGYLLGLGRSSDEEESTGKFAFKHVGYRSQRWRGMIQRIDADCLTEDSVWSITASFRYFATDTEGNESPASCNLDSNLASGSCPVFDIEFITPRQGDPTFITTGPMRNEVTDDSSVESTTSPGEWNEIAHTLVVTGEMAQHTT